MPTSFNIWDKVYQIGGAGLSHGSDAYVFLVDVGNGSSVLIDSGAGQSFKKLVKNMQIMGFDPKNLKALILTHCHIDHIGSAFDFKNRFDCQMIAHEKDRDAIEGGNPSRTAAEWYGVDYKPVTVDRVLTQDLEKIVIGDMEFNCLHTPGHTPGSISVYCDITGRRVLFGQDIHGPFDASFGSNIDDWKRSMGKLLALKADILCEGHFGIYRPSQAVKRYIEGYLRRY